MTPPISKNTHPKKKFKVPSLDQFAARKFVGGGEPGEAWNEPAALPFLVTAIPTAMDTALVTVSIAATTGSPKFLKAFQ
jgi:hypothetical protein